MTLRAAEPERLPADASGVAEAARRLRAGELVAVPTESSYALAADPRHASASARVRALKGRHEHGKPLLLLAASLDQAAAWGSFDERAMALATAWPAPLTLVVPPRDPELARRLGGEGLALRVPATATARAVAAALGAPFTGTSANLAGQPPALDADDAARLPGLDAVIDAGTLPGGAPSTLVDARGGAAIVRPGAFPRGDLHARLATAHGLSSAMLPPYIGLTGPNSSGKGATADLLVRELGYAPHSLSDVVRDEARTRGLEPTRDVLIRIGNELRAEGGPGVLAERIARRLEPPALVDSIRNPAEVEVLRRLPGFLLIAIEAPVDLRFERSLARARPGDPPTIEEFLEKEGRENSTNPLAQQLKTTAALADRVLVNDGSIDALRAHLHELLRL